MAKETVIMPEEKVKGAEAITKTAQEELNAILYEKNEVTEEVQPRIELPKIYISRRKYTSKDGKNFWEYVLPVVFCGARMEVHFLASDRNGYEGLEKLFGSGLERMELCFEENRQYDEHTGASRKYFSYKAVYADSTGFVWEFPLAIKSKSDKAYMENYIRYLRHLVENEKK